MGLNFQKRKYNENDSSDFFASSNDSIFKTPSDSDSFDKLVKSVKYVQTCFCF